MRATQSFIAEDGQDVVGRAAHGRSAERACITMPARLTWKDQSGATRFASVVTRNISEFGVYVESQSPISIPMYRLVQFQLEGEVRQSKDVPLSLRSGRTLSAVYRVTPPDSSGGRHGLALRLMVDPKQFGTGVVERTQATA